MITEEIMDDLRESENGRVMGRVRYTYKSPTHWCQDGICQVTLHYGWMERPDVSINWGSGGVNRGFTEREIAVAMSEAFKMASKRLEQLERIVDIAQGETI
jgi:hypothetical protein